MLAEYGRVLVSHSLSSSEIRVWKFAPENSSNAAGQSTVTHVESGRQKTPFVDGVPYWLPSALLGIVEALGHAVGEHPRKFVLCFDHRARRLGVAPLQYPLLLVRRRVNELADLPLATVDERERRRPENGSSYRAW